MALLTRDRDEQATTASPIEAVAEVLHPSHDDTDRSYGRAVLLGSGLGIVIWGAVVFAVLRLIQPDMAAGAALGIAVWVGLWTGLFLGGTITVGLWSDKHH